MNILSLQTGKKKLYFHIILTIFLLFNGCKKEEDLHPVYKNYSDITRFFDKLLEEKKISSYQIGLFEALGYNSTGVVDIIIKQGVAVDTLKVSSNGKIYYSSSLLKNRENTLEKLLK